MSRIVVTGGAGYLGSVLVPMLLALDHDVTVIDDFRYKQTSLLGVCHHHKLTILNQDVQRVSWKSALYTADIIIPLAALVGAPLCDKSTNTLSINAHTIEDLCHSANQNQTILYPMTNSGYGTGGEKECTEESPLLPISLYGKSKTIAERSVRIHPRGISFRFATLFGCSPRMRLDLLVNDFSYRAVRDKSLTLFEGKFKRNYLHVRDAASVFLFAIHNGERLGMFGEAYNVGLSSANLSKLELCAKIADHVPGFVYHESAVGEDPDKRDYCVSNAKIEALGWRPQYTLDEGIRELVRSYAMPMENNFRNT